MQMPPVGLEVVYQYRALRFEMLLTLDQLGGAAGEAPALCIKFLHRLLFAVMDGFDFAPEPVFLGIDLAGEDQIELLTVLRPQPGCLAAVLGDLVGLLLFELHGDMGCGPEFWCLPFTAGLLLRSLRPREDGAVRCLVNPKVFQGISVFSCP